MSLFFSLISRANELNQGGVTWLFSSGLRSGLPSWRVRLPARSSPRWFPAFCSSLIRDLPSPFRFSSIVLLTSSTGSCFFPIPPYRNGFSFVGWRICDEFVRFLVTDFEFFFPSLPVCPRVPWTFSIIS